MKRLWFVVNVGILVFSIWQGAQMTKDFAHPHPLEDWIACPLILIGAYLFTFCSIWFSKCDSFSRFSWDRFPLNWWYDPLQSLFMTTCIVTGWAVGSAFSLFYVGTNGLINLALFSSGAAGFHLGQLSIYKVYRRRIIEE